MAIEMQPIKKHVPNQFTASIKSCSLFGFAKKLSARIVIVLRLYRFGVHSTVESGSHRTNSYGDRSATSETFHSTCSFVDRPSCIW